jgi:hypothetical protein
MSTNERDTHFQGFAKLLIEEMVMLHGSIDITAYWTLSGDFWSLPGDEATREYVDIIARRAYDLLDHASQYVLTCPEDVPDFTQWPDFPHDTT